MSQNEHSSPEQTNPHENLVDTILAELHEADGYRDTLLTDIDQEAVFRPGSLLDSDRAVLRNRVTYQPVLVMRTGDPNATGDRGVTNWVITQATDIDTSSSAFVAGLAGETTGDFAEPKAAITTEGIILGSHAAFGNLAPGEKPRQDVFVKLDEHGNIVVKNLNKDGTEVVAKEGSAVTPTDKTVVLNGIRGAALAKKDFDSPISYHAKFIIADPDKVNAIVTPRPGPAHTRVQ